jgi:hypothetical protein
MSDGVIITIIICATLVILYGISAYRDGRK